MKINAIFVLKALDEKGLNPSNLRRFGFSPITISKIMKGNDVRPGTILKLSKVLSVPMELIVKEDPNIFLDNLEKAVIRR